MADIKGQLQLCFQWPGRGFRVDTIRIASIDIDEWEAMLAYVSAQAGAFPILKQSLVSAYPWKIRREDLAQLRQECDSLIDYDRFGEPEMGALSTLSMLASQALDQREAVLSVEHWPDAHFETQVYIAPGVDLLADLIEIDERKMR